jgi:hypothetical protein
MWADDSELPYLPRLDSSTTEERIPSLLPYVAMDGFVDKGGVEPKSGVGKEIRFRKSSSVSQSGGSGGYE